MNRFALALALALSLALLGLSSSVLLSPGIAEARPTLHEPYVCYHNGFAYTEIFVPFTDSSPECPDDPDQWNPAWDNHDNLDCQDQEDPDVCLRERHIDCEFGAKPGRI